MRRLDDKSRMSREAHVRIRERLGVRLPRATRLVVTVSGHHTKRGWAEWALQRLQEELAPLGVELTRFSPFRETPRLCRGGSRSLTYEGVHRGNSRS